jgi:pilus assembly protein CpaE
MPNTAQQSGDYPREEQAGERSAGVARIPAITIQAFYDTPEVAEVIETAAADRRMARAHVTVRAGGIAAAIDFYRQQPSPQLIVVESQAAGEALIGDIDHLAEVCEPGTKVVVIGASNDIGLYRELLGRGVSEYMVAPIDAMQLMALIARLYRETGAERLGKVYAFIGAKGGVGASTIAHNVAWSMTRLFDSDVILADLDLPFGTAGLDFNLEGSQGMAEAVQDSGRLDEVLLERLLSKHDDHLSLLLAPAALERSYDLGEGALDRMLDVVQSTVPSLILDVPHAWNAWTKKTLLSADEVVITAAPDLANLRNAKNLIEFFSAARPNDPPPKLVLNQVGLPKRPEIKPGDFAAGLELEPIACIPFDPVLFGTAANKGKMVAEVSPRSKTADRFGELARIVTGRSEVKRRGKAPFGLGRLWGS